MKTAEWKWARTRTVLMSTCSMMIAAAIIAFLYLLGLGVLAVALRRAPEGFEDAEGFHAGQKELQEEVSL